MFGSKKQTSSNELETPVAESKGVFKKNENNIKSLIKNRNSSRWDRCKLYKSY